MSTGTNNTTSKGRNGSVIRKCSCENAWQDMTYSKGKRAHTMGQKQDTCTVCGSVKNMDFKD